MLRRRLPLALFALALGCASAAAAAPRPIVIAHRGASGERPEHTRSAYELAIAEGADFIEPDLVMTRDGVLVDRHENEIGGTTDVAKHPEFAARRTTKEVDGQSVTGWFTEDFTLAELRTLRARERLPQLRPGNAAHDGEDGVLSFQQVIDIAKAGSRRTGRSIGVYAELKHPTYFAAHGLPMEARFVEVLKANGLARRDAPLIFQCFEPGSLQKVRRLADVRQVLLIDSAGAPADFKAAGDPRSYRDLLTPAALRAIRPFADGVGPDKTLIVPRDAAGRSLPATSLIADAHAAGLVVHPYTFRAENYFLPLELRRGDPAAPDYLRQHGDFAAELRQFYALGVDGLFSDYPGEAVAARGTR